MKVFISRETFGPVRIWVTDEFSSGHVSVAKIVNGRFEFGPVDENADAAPTLTLYREAGPFLAAMAEALDAQGVKTDSDAKIAGTLEATRYHLEDLRDMLDLKHPRIAEAKG